MHTLTPRREETPSNEWDILDFSGTFHAFAHDLTEDIFAREAFPFARYPEHSTAAAEAAAVLEGVGPEHILTGNGPDELLWRTLDALQVRRMLIIGPVPSQAYLDYCSARNVALQVAMPPPEQDFTFGAAEFRAVWDANADLLVIPSPSGITGALLPGVHDLLAALRIPRVLADHTYREFFRGTPEFAVATWQAYASFAQPGVSVYTLTSFSEFFCCPGLCFAYLTGDAGHIRRMAESVSSRPLSPYADVMVPKLVEAAGAYRGLLAPMRQTGETTAMSLRRMACFDPDRVFTGPGFLLAGLADTTPPTEAARRLMQRNIRVLPLTARDIGGRDARGYLRIQIRPEAETEKLLDALTWHADRGW